MTDRIGKALMENWADYLKYSSAHVSDYQAICRLGEFVNLLHHDKIPQPLADKWRLALDSQKISAGSLSKAIAGMQKDVARLRHVMSIGDEFIFEETMLLITLRVNVQLAMEFFESRGVSVTVDLQDVDDSLRSIARSGQNFSAYESARRMARKNWGLPIVSRWLDS
ncbi:hypothetical protein [Taklimakanibacter lacteus]|uniref:hypothetical protein n=1 Tax=Taklimakanibacter lacteus TaxID=2268456 RepID=UPI000E671EC8